MAGATNARVTRFAVAGTKVVSSSSGIRYVPEGLSRHGCLAAIDEATSVAGNRIETNKSFRNGVVEIVVDDTRRPLVLLFARFTRLGFVLLLSTLGTSPHILPLWQRMNDAMTEDDRGAHKGQDPHDSNKKASMESVGAS